MTTASLTDLLKPVLAGLPGATFGAAGTCDLIDAPRGARRRADDDEEDLEEDGDEDEEDED